MILTKNITEKYFNLMFSIMTIIISCSSGFGVFWFYKTIYNENFYLSMIVANIMTSVVTILFCVFYSTILITKSKWKKKK